MFIACGILCEVSDVQLVLVVTHPTYELTSLRTLEARCSVEVRLASYDGIWERLLQYQGMVFVRESVPMDKMDMSCQGCLDCFARNL